VSSGQLPTGLALSTAGVLSGVPTAAGTVSFTVTASNGVAPNAISGSIALSVSPASVAPQFTAAQPPTAAVAGSIYSYQFRASGSPAPTFSVQTGQMPAGLALDPVSGQLSGTLSTAGSYSFKVQASNGVGAPAATPAITVTVSASNPSSTDVQMIFTGPSVTYSPAAGAYTVAAKNAGTSISAVNSVLTLVIPPGAVVGPLPAGVTQVGDTLIYRAASIAPGKNVKFAVTLQLPATQTLTASVSTDTADPLPDNNTGTVTTVIR
jgi:hypothetical protein